VSFLRVDLAGLNGLLDTMGERAEEGARPSAQAASQVLYDEVKKNVSAIGRRSGNLDRSIYQAYSEANSGAGRATYHVSWNPRKAPHGHLLEFGYIQRYVSYMGKDGNWYTAVRPSMRGKKAPSRTASPAVKAAYYVPLATPKQVAARPFVRKAQSAFAIAQLAAEQKLLEIINHGPGK
jgi:hypothetical protein